MLLGTDVGDFFLNLQIFSVLSFPFEQNHSVLNLSGHFQATSVSVIIWVASVLLAEACCLYGLTESLAWSSCCSSNNASKSCDYCRALRVSMHQIGFTRQAWHVLYIKKTDLLFFFNAIKTRAWLWFRGLMQIATLFSLLKPKPGTPLINFYF